MSRIKHLVKNNLVNPPPPPYVYNSLCYETIMGSQAYGCQDTSKISDTDIYGFCVPSKELVFPHTAGEIVGFGNQKQRFNNWQQHHLKDEQGLEYDFDIYNIVQYFQLCMGANPNMIDSIFTPERCVTFKNPVAQMVRDGRKLFLSKKAFHTFRGYAYQQMHKMKIKTPEEGSKRLETVKAFGYDVKWAYHLVRLVDECRQILVEYDLNLDRNSEQLKSIRKGEWKEEDVCKFFDEQKISLEKLYNESKIPHSPDEKAIKNLLINCLEAHFGSLEGCVVREDAAGQALRDIRTILDRSGY